MAVQSSRRTDQRQIAIEKGRDPHQPAGGDRRTGVDLSGARGIDEAQARKIAEQILSDEENALDTLAREGFAILILQS